MTENEAADEAAPEAEDVEDELDESAAAPESDEDDELAEEVEEAVEGAAEEVEGRVEEAEEAVGGAAEGASDDEDDGEEAEVESGIQDGDFVRLHYTVRTEADDQVIDTTREDVAEEAGLTEDNPDYEFEPRVVVVGAGHVFPGVEEAIKGGEAGDEGTVHVPAAEAFGEYDQDQVRTVSAEKIDEDDRHPGAQVQVDGQQGYVETIVGGRARVDFNHPLAGESLEYEYEILDVVDDDEEKAKGMLEMYLPQEPELRIEEETVEEEMNVEVHETEEGEVERETELQEVDRRTLYVEATPQMQMNQQWMFQKQQVAQDLINRLALDRVVIEEVIEAGAGGMGGMGGMMGGMGGMGGADLEEELEDMDVDADEIVEELEDAEE